MFKKTIATLLLFTTLLSCTKDESMTNNGSNPGIMSADIGGSLWYANSGYAQSPNPTALNLYAAFNNLSYISVQLDGYSGPNNYVLGGFNKAIFSDGSGNTYTATNGNINITQDNGTQIMGTFYFSGTDQISGNPISVSNGQFNLTK